MDWQPIETVPADDQEVDLALWSEGTDFSNVPRGYRRVVDARIARGGWCEWNAQMERYDPIEFGGQHVTHWMRVELPPDPA